MLLSSPKRRLRVMHVVYDLGPGGLENLAIEICSRLPSEEFAASICVFKRGGVREARLDQNRVELVHVQRLFGNDPTVPIRLAWQLRRRRIDILHTHLWSTLIEGVLARKLARTPMMVHLEHGDIPDRRRQILAQRWGWGAADRTVAVSAALADRMTSIVGFERDRIQVIPNGVDPAIFRPLDGPKALWRLRFGLPADAFIVGMVARFVEFKNHAGLLRAVARLLPRQETSTVGRPFQAVLHSCGICRRRSP